MKRSIFFFLVASLLVSASYKSQAEFTIRSRKIDNISYLHLDDVVKYLGFNVQGNEKKIYLSNIHAQIVLPVGKRKAYINSILSYLSFAIRLNRQSYFISEQDFLLLINPLIRNDSLPKHAINRIILDPGHGGMDSGAVGTRLVEKNVNLELAKQLKSLLETRDYSVLLTRHEDNFISLSQRGIIARNWHADLFISIHCNSAPNNHVTGIETFIVTPKGSPSAAKEALEPDAVFGNAFDTLNARLSHEIQKNLINETGAPDRGIKYHRWQVLREASCPAVLIETGFLSNLGEEKKLSYPDYRNRIVVGMANGIIEFHNALNHNKR